MSQLGDSSKAFERLHPSVRYLVREVLRFPGLRPVQAQTVGPVLDGRDVFVLARTAGGKTEASLLPVLSRILSERLAPVSTLYVCPLRALLNNIEPRVQRMAQAVGLRAGKWHGDVPTSQRKAMVAEPPDVLLITPESLEVLLIGASDANRRLLDHVRVAIVDEVHAFASDPRGAHLVSVLERLQHRRLDNGHIQRIGLSATVGNPDTLAKWLQGGGSTGEPAVVAPPAEARTPRFRYAVGQEPFIVARHIERLGHGQKRLVFVESRSRAEELARALEQLGVRAFAHHSSVGTKAREEAEQAFESRPSAVLVATSSMELGIDVGDLDHVFQLDAPATVSSLAQRLGRTGRRPGTEPQITFVARTPADLVLAAALAELFVSGWMEPIEPPTRLWTVLVHQTFANVLETGGCTRGQLTARLQSVPSFSGFTGLDLEAHLDHLLAEGWLDAADGRLLLGRRAEKRFGAKNFLRLYAVFDAPASLAVRFGEEEVGSLQSWFAAQLTGTTPSFRLAGRSWEVRDLDFQRGVVHVIPARKGVVPSWTGRPTAYGRRVCEQILDLLTDPAARMPDGFDSDAVSWLSQVRESLSDAGLPPAARTSGVRPVQPTDGRVSVWHTYAGGRINAVIVRLLARLTGLEASSSNLSVKVRSAAASVPEALLRVQEALAESTEPPLDEWATFDAASRANVLSAFQECLPEAAEQEFLRSELLDLPGARRWAREIR